MAILQIIDLTGRLQIDYGCGAAQVHPGQAARVMYCSVRINVGNRDVGFVMRRMIETISESIVGAGNSCVNVMQGVRCHGSVVVW